jgi:hypothetical protein
MQARRAAAAIASRRVDLPLGPDQPPRCKATAPRGSPRSVVPSLEIEFSAELLFDESVGLEILDRLRGDPALGRAHVLLLDLAVDCVPAETSGQPMPESGHSSMIARIDEREPAAEGAHLEV